jgi:hypothetical protein
MYSTLNDKKYYLDIDELLEYIKMDNSYITDKQILIDKPTDDSDETDDNGYKINAIKWDVVRYMIDALMVNDIPEEHDYELNKLPLTKGIAINTLKYYKILKEHGE